MNAMEEAALAYLDRGWSPIPAKQGEKVPRFAWKEYQEQRATAEEIHKWYAVVPNGNISIVTGEISNLLVIDVDGNEGLLSLGANNQHGDIVLPPTYTVKTPQGFHFYYHYQEKPSTIAGLLDHVDVRSNGGCVCAPPSITPDGVYTVLDNRDIAELGDVFDGIQPRRNHSSTHEASDNWIVDLLRNGAPNGTRNDQAARLAGYLKTKHPVDIVSALMENWNNINQPPLEDAELQAVINSVERYHHPRSTFTMGSWDYFPHK